MGTIALAIMFSCATGARAANSGSFTATAIGGASLSVSGEATFDCRWNTFLPDYCAYYLVVHIVPAAQPCSESGPWYVSAISEQPTRSFAHGALAYGWTEESWPPIRICLYLNTGYTDHPPLLAEAVLDRARAQTVRSTPAPQPEPPIAPPSPPLPPAPVPPAAPPPPTTPAPPVTPPSPTGPTDARCDDFAFQEDAQEHLDSLGDDAGALDGDDDGIACENLPSRRRSPTLSKAQAQRVTHTALVRRLGARFTDRRAYRVSCGRLSYRQVRCRARWRTRRGLWRATVTVRTFREGGRVRYRWTTSVSAPPQRRSGPAASPPGVTPYRSAHARSAPRARTIPRAPVAQR